MRAIFVYRTLYCCPSLLVGSTVKNDFVAVNKRKQDPREILALLHLIVDLSPCLSIDTYRYPTRRSTTWRYSPPLAALLPAVSEYLALPILKFHILDYIICLQHITIHSLGQHIGLRHGIFTTKYAYLLFMSCAGHVARQNVISTEY